MKRATCDRPTDVLVYLLLATAVVPLLPYLAVALVLGLIWLLSIVP